jgi:hypothetical protein
MPIVLVLLVTVWYGIVTEGTVVTSSPTGPYLEATSSTSDSMDQPKVFGERLLDTHFKPADLPMPESLSGELAPENFKNVIVIPDVHGDRESLIQSLWLAFDDVEDDTIDFEAFRNHIEYFERGNRERLALSDDPEDTIVIQLGDVVDRGPEGRECLAILDIIELAIGWKTIRLYGNHEIMSHLNKSWSFIHREEIKRFSAYYGYDAARTKEFEMGGSLWDRITNTSLLMARIGTPADKSSVASDLTVDGFQPLNSASTLLVHGGIDPHWVDHVESMHEDGDSIVSLLNSFTTSVLSGKSEMNSVHLFEKMTSPLWTRDLAQMDQHYVCKRLLPRVLKQYNVARLVVGHTPQFDREMKSLCGSRLILADAAMSRWMFTDPERTRGSPTALVMKQRDGLLWHLQALYLEASGKVRHQVIYRQDIGGIDYKPTEGYRKPELVDIYGSTVSSRSIYPIRFGIDSTGQRMQGRLAYDLITEIRTRKPIHSFGIPTILYQSQLGIGGQDAAFYVIMDAYGDSLATSGEVPVPIRRQILEIARDLWDFGYTLDYAFPSSNPQLLLDSFIVDDAVNMVKFVDFARLRRRSESSDVNDMVGPIIADLSLIRMSDMTDFVSHLFLLQEAFGELVDLRIINTKYISRVRKGSFPSPMKPTTTSTTPTPVTYTTFQYEETGADLEDAIASLQGVRRFLDEDEDETLELKRIGAHLRIVWGVTSLKRLSGNLYGATFDSSSSLKVSRGVICHVRSLDSALKTFDAVVSLATKDETPGFAKIAGTHRLEQGGLYVAWEIDFRYLVSVRNSDDVPVTIDQVDVARDIINSIAFFHKNKVSLNMEDSFQDLQDKFWVDCKSSSAWLLDITNISIDSAKDKESFDKQLSVYRLSLSGIFHGIVIEEKSPDRRRRNSFSFDEQEKINSGKGQVFTSTSDI